LFGLAWPAPHRVVANAATRRWCEDNGNAKLAPRLINSGSGVLARLPDWATAPLTRIQMPSLPVFSPTAPTVGMPASAVDRAALVRGRDGPAHDIRHRSCA
jgi:nitronate monooxygenase